MDCTFLPACDDKLDMLKTTSRIDPNLNAAMVDGRRFSVSEHGRGASRVKSNFVVVPRCRSKESLERNRDIRLANGKDDDMTESRELSRGSIGPVSPSSVPMQQRSKDHSLEGRGDHLRGMFCLQSLSSLGKTPNKRPSPETSPGYDLYEGKNMNQRDRTSETDDGSRSSDNCSNKSVQYQVCSAPDNCSGGVNILSKMYASFGNESSHAEKRYLSKTNPSVKTEPNYEEYNIPPKRTKRNSNNQLSNATGSNTRKASRLSPSLDSTHPFDRAPSPSTQRNSGRHSQLSTVRNHTSSQRKRLNERAISERHLTTKKRKLSTEIFESSKPHEADLCAEYNGLSHQVPNERMSSLPDRVGNNSRNSGMVCHTERNHPFIPDQAPENIVRLPNYSFIHDQINAMSPMGCNGMGFQHDPNILLKTASLGVSPVNPFLLGMNACVMNPFLMSSLEHSEIMAAAAYRQTIASQMLKNRIAGMKPLLGLGLMDSANSIYGGLSNIMYGIPEPTHLANCLGSAFRFNSPASSSNAHLHESTHSGILHETRKMPRVRCRESPNSTRHDSIHSSRIDHEDQLSKSPLHGGKHSESPRDLPSMKNTFRSLSQPAIPEDNLHSDESENYKCTRIGDHKNSTSRTKAQTTDFGKKKPPDQVSAEKNLVELPSELPHAVSARQNDIPEEDKSSPTDGKVFARASTYKNLTRERRLVANARERTRVHTISSAFEELRRQIPSYSCNQKLSKLAILRIACSYIQSLSVLAGRSTEGTFKESVDQCTGVLQAESKARCRRKNTKAQVEWEMESYEKSAPSSSRNGPDCSPEPRTSPHSLDYWQSNRLLHGTRGVDSSSNDSDPSSSPSHNESACTTGHCDLEKMQSGKKIDETSSSIGDTMDETISELSPINVDD